MNLERKRKFVAAMVFLVAHIVVSLAIQASDVQWVAGLLGLAGFYLGAEAYEGGRHGGD